MRDTKALERVLAEDTTLSLLDKGFIVTVLGNEVNPYIPEREVLRSINAIVRLYMRGYNTYSESLDSIKSTVTVYCSEWVAENINVESVFDWFKSMYFITSVLLDER